MTVLMILAALVLQNISVLELRKCRLFRLPTEVVACIGTTGVVFSASVILTEFGYYTLSSNLTDNLLSAGIGESAVANTATGLVWLFWFCYAFCWYWLAASVLPLSGSPDPYFERPDALCICLPVAEETVDPSVPLGDGM